LCRNVGDNFYKMSSLLSPSARHASRKTGNMRMIMIDAGSFIKIGSALR